MSSVYDKLGRIRTPAVHISYDVETDGATIKHELPFVVGVMGDYAGDPTSPVKPLTERKFVEIDRDNFDAVLKRIAPGLNIRVENTLAGDKSEMAVNLKFESMDDFDPVAVAKQVPALKALLETRSRLRELVTKADLSQDLEVLLENILKDKSLLDKLSDEIGAKKQEG